MKLFLKSLMRDFKFNFFRKARFFRFFRSDLINGKWHNAFTVFPECFFKECCGKTNFCSSLRELESSASSAL